MPDSLQGREILLAGGFGGIGSAVATMLSAEGARLVVSYRSNRARAEKLCDIAQIVQADLAWDAERKRLLDAAPRLYALVILPGDPARCPLARTHGKP